MSEGTDDRNVSGITDYFLAQLSANLGEDRLIPLPGVGRFVYVDAEACEFYLVTVQPARVVPYGKDDTA